MRQHPGYPGMSQTTPGYGIHYARARTSNPSFQTIEPTVAKQAGHVIPTRYVTAVQPVPSFGREHLMRQHPGYPGMSQTTPGYGIPLARARTSNPSFQTIEATCHKQAGHVIPTRYVTAVQPVPSFGREHLMRQHPMYSLPLHVQPATTCTACHYMYSLPLHVQPATTCTACHYMYSLPLHVQPATTCTACHYMYSLPLHVQPATTCTACHSG